MKKLLLSGVIISGLILANPITAAAYPKRGSECGKCESKSQQCKISKLKKKIKPLWIHKDVLGLNDKQLDQIKDIKHSAIKELIQLKADKDIIKVDLKSALWEESIDLEAVNKLIDAKYAAKIKAAKVYTKAIADVQQVLSKKQRGQWKDIQVQAKLSEGGCPKCPGSGPKTCPLTGKVLEAKGSGSGQ